MSILQPRGRTRAEAIFKEAELATVEGLLAGASVYCPDLKCPGGYENVFDPVGGGLYSIDTDEEGLCVLAYEGGE